MLTKKHPDLHAVNTLGAFLVADGAPLVWASRWGGMPLPERVAGSDLIFDLLPAGGREEIQGLPAGRGDGHRRRGGEEAVSALPQTPHRLASESPPFWCPHRRGARPCWWPRIRVRGPISYRRIWPAQGRVLDRRSPPGRPPGVPVCVQVGASLDFVAGQVRRAPRVLQRLGLEWAYRMWREPRRLVIPDVCLLCAQLLLGMVARDLFRGVGLRISEFASSADTSGC